MIVYHICGCGNCYACRKGWIVNCTSEQRSVYGWHRDGAYADFMLAEEYTLLDLPDELSFVDGAIISCGFGTSFQGAGGPTYPATTRSWSSASARSASPRPSFQRRAEHESLAWT